MIICSCNCINDKAIRDIVYNLTQQDPNCMLTPGLVYRELGVRAQCNSCLTAAIEIIIDEIDHPSHDGCQVIQLTEQRNKIMKKRKKSVQLMSKINKIQSQVIDI